MNITRVLKSRISIPARILALVFIVYAFTFVVFPNRNHNSPSNLIKDSTVQRYPTRDSAYPTTQRTRKLLFDNPNLAQNDSELLEYLLEHHLIQPDPNLKRKTKYFPVSTGKAMIGHMFGKKGYGTFIEAGANDGVFLSNTLFLERWQGWTGLLIEPDDVVFPELKTSSRNAWIANVCLAVKPYPHKANIRHRRGTNPWNRGSGILQPNTDVPRLPDYGTNEFFLVSEKECFPLYSLLAAIKMTTVDLFSLDVQGVEYKILKAIPFESVDIKVIYVEHNIIPEGLPALKDLILPNGYDLYYQDNEDVIFMKKGYKLVGNVPK